MDFDIIGLSYYPFWHGTFADLKGNLESLAQTYKKDIIVAETGYDMAGGDQNKLPFPPTPEGQNAFLEELVRTVAATPDGRGKGVFYWAPEWIGGQKWAAQAGQELGRTGRCSTSQEMRFQRCKCFKDRKKATQSALPATE